MLNTNIFAASPYLSRLAAQYQNNAFLITHSEDPQALQQLIAQVTHYANTLLTDTQAVMLFLREQKQLFALLWSAQRLTNILSQQQAGYLQSEFAAATIHLAFKAACASKEFLVYSDAQTKIINGVFILGLGKLGGYDLNFSSDVDLIAFYDSDIITIDVRLGRTHLVSKLLSKTTHILNTLLNNEFVWRVDWRLRPNASVKYLSMPTNQAINFYYFQSMPWHRLAMIKARIVGGDTHAGEKFLDNIKSFLWKRNLDFRAIDEIASLKQRINAEHPRLQKQRTHIKNDNLVNFENFNFKLGHGGIREIEFLVNALQLIWGGKKTNLRNTHTLSTLEELVKEALMSAPIAAQLNAAYNFLRRSEDALQMMQNQQTYTTPTDPADRQAWLNLLNETQENFCTQLEQHRKIITREFNNLFSVKENIQQNSFNWEQFNEQLDERSKNIIRDWQQGFLIYGAMPSQASQLTKLADLLGNVIKHSDLELNLSITKVDGYLRQLPGGGQYLNLLQKHPQLLDKLITPLLLSTAMATLLKQSPHIVDCFLETSSAENLQAILDRDYLFNEKDPEQKLEKLRRHTNEEKYKQYLYYLEGQINNSTLEQHLTQLADEVLQIALDMAHQHFKLSPSSFSIIGLGKLGMRTLMPLSDLDLMYLFNTDLTVTQANKIASHLNIILHSRMREGRVYELDTRLRPSGRSGSPTISLSSFENYHQTQAFNWEHLALFPARFICGSAAANEKFSRIRLASLTRQRNRTQWRTDCLKMLERIKEQRIQKSDGFLFSSKLRTGGLMQAEYLLACIGVEQAQLTPQILNEDYLQRISYIDDLKQQNFLESLNFWRHLQIAIRIFGHENVAIEQLPEPVQAILLSQLAIDNLNLLNEKIDYHAAKINTLTNIYFDSVDKASIKAWQEKPVIWQDLN